MEKHRPIDSKDYQEHYIFSELKTYTEFYDSLSFSVSSFGTTGTDQVINLDTYILSSIKGTIESIFLILKDGKINDSYALLRKLYDSTIIHIYTNLYLDDRASIENFIVEKINNWIKGTEQLPEFRVMSNYIRKSEKVAAINGLLYSNDRYKDIRNRCNDNTHYNYFYNVILNDNEIHIEHRIKILNSLSVDIKDIFILHLAYLFFIKDHFMTSSDYMDALEIGIEPEIDSQYWVAPFIQEVLDNIVSKHRPDILKVVKQNSSMHLQ